jgi:hypothetical protein
MAATWGCQSTNKEKNVAVYSKGERPDAVTGWDLVDFRFIDNNLGASLLKE